MTRWLFVRKPTIKNIMQRTENKFWPSKNDIVPRTPRFSNHVVKAGMKTTGRGSPAAREPIVNRTRSTSEITEDNIVKTTGKRINEYWRSYYAKNKEEIRQRLRDQKQRQIGQNNVCSGAWNQKSEKLKTSIVSSVRLCETPTVKT